MRCKRLLPIFMAAVLISCSLPREDSFVTVKDGRMYRNGCVYRFIGTNFWYGAILASEGQGGNRARLAAELDSLHALGVDNLRILVGADGNRHKPSLVWPTLQTSPGIYNDTILAGLDWLLKEMGERHMTAVLYLNNAWEWSGGYGQYLEWVGEGPAPDPTLDGYTTYTDYVSRFPTNRAAQQLYFKHVRAIVSRTNRYTGRAYTEDPAIMAWQIANEPRPFARDSMTKNGFFDWVIKAAGIVKDIDMNHLVSVGSEGLVGCEMDMDLYETIHSNPNIDYLTIHIWPMNWGWITRDEMREDSLGRDSAKMNKCLRLTDDYLLQHLVVAQRLNKPLVLEEFGYARDGLSFELNASTNARDIYFSHIFSLFNADCELLNSTTSNARNHQSFPTHCLAGVNFWSWSGQARPRHERWLPFDDYCGDPAQEEQGLFSVFLSDTSTIKIIRQSFSHIN